MGNVAQTQGFRAAGEDPPKNAPLLIDLPQLPRAGMSLNDPANKVRVQGHQGPHPQEYRERIYNRLDEATKGCSSIEQCRKALTAELERLAKQISTEGTSLNKLVTREQ